MNKKVVIGLSGGVDSSVSALLLKKQGFEVIGVTLKLWEETGKFSSADYIKQASDFAANHNIKHIVFDAKKDFKSKIIDSFIDEYISGKTPIICSLCNKIIKFDILNKIAEENNCDYIATGHYINVIKHENKFYIKKAKDQIKDQSYFLWELQGNILQKLLTPLGKLTKTEVRELAKEFGLKEIFNKKESMSICFLQNTDYRKFIDEKAGPRKEKIKPGNVYDERGNLIGKHQGLAYYTVGQKNGLDIHKEGKFYVKKMNAKTNSIIVSDKKSLNTNVVYVNNLSFIDINDLKKYNGKLNVKIRGYGLNPEKECFVNFIDDDLIEVKLNDFAWAPAPGQAVVFYYNDLLLGGGITV